MTPQTEIITEALRLESTYRGNVINILISELAQVNIKNKALEAQVAALTVPPAPLSPPTPPPATTS